MTPVRIAVLSPNAKRALTRLFLSIEREATKRAADHLQTAPVRGKPIMLVKRGSKSV
jgi:hypothetical protein